MKVLVVGAGGVGSAFARIAAQRSSFAKVVIADFDRGKAERAAHPPRASSRACRSMPRTSRPSQT